MVMTAEDKATMDEAANTAREDLKAIVATDPEGVQKVANWIKKHYLGAGYRRLGRILADIGE